MAMTISEQIEHFNNDLKEDELILSQGIAARDFAMVRRLGNSMVNSCLSLGLLKWRIKENPTQYFRDAIQRSQEVSKELISIHPDQALKYPLKSHFTIYAAYLIGAHHEPVNLESNMVNEHTKADAFFGNVLTGAADIADWPKYRKALPEGRRYELARRSNELYADLLAGRIDPERGVSLGEKFWEEREDNDYYETDFGGSGGDNSFLVDYQLGAILKKIGSTVPTIHAWVW